MSKTVPRPAKRPRSTDTSSPATAAAPGRGARHFAIIGAGMAGIACARTLVQAGHQVTVFEQAAAPGGRTATVDSAFGSFDAGAQYFTVRDPRFARAIDTVPGLCKPWSANNVRVLDASGRVTSPGLLSREAHWVASPGMQSLVTTWAGFSFKWYGELMRDTVIIEGFVLSLKIALMTATASVLLGTFAAVALVKFPRFTGRTFFSGMVNSPLVMPEVIIGLSLLLTLVSLQRLTEDIFGTGWPDRGTLTIWIGHTLLGMAYATVVITSRLREMNPQLEEAALDLGAKPWQVFFLVTLPLISQALASAWLLSFTLSLDDVVLSAFLSGPGSTTLPLAIFSRARLGLSPSINAVATLRSPYIKLTQPRIEASTNFCTSSGLFLTVSARVSMSVLYVEKP